MSTPSSENYKPIIIAVAATMALAAVAGLIIWLVPGSNDTSSQSNQAASNQNQANNQDQAQSQSGASDQQSAPTPAATDTGNQQTTASQSTTVKITADGFSPAAITIARGTTITWRNTDTTAHAVDPASGGNGPHSPQLKPDATFSYSFQEAGTYKYIDPIKPEHGGTVTVKNPE